MRNISSELETDILVQLRKCQHGTMKNKIIKCHVHGTKLLGQSRCIRWHQARSLYKQQEHQRLRTHKACAFRPGKKAHLLSLQTVPEIKHPGDTL